jgi:hypothetical protein
MRTLLCGIVVGVVLGGTRSGDLLAQSSDEGAVSLDFVIADSEELPAPPVRWRLYGEPRQLRFRFSVANDTDTSNVPFLLDTEGIRPTVGLIVEREAEIPITLQWLDEEVTLNSEPFALPSGSPWVRLEPDQYLGWTIVAERADGQPFESGQYYLTSGFVGVRSAVRHVDGTPWRGRVPEGVGQRTFVVGPPTSTTERVRMHEIAASAAKARGDTAQALSEYTQLLQVDPGNVNAQLMIGHLHYQAGRYRDAITWWERAAPNLHRDRPHSIRLAAAYVGAGQDGRAIEVLQAAGLSDEAIATELERWRRAAAERPPAQ